MRVRISFGQITTNDCNSRPWTPGSFERGRRAQTKSRQKRGAPDRRRLAIARGSPVALNAHRASTRRRRHLRYSRLAHTVAEAQTGPDFRLTFITTHRGSVACSDAQGRDRAGIPRCHSARTQGPRTTWLSGGCSRPITLGSANLHGHRRELRVHRLPTKLIANNRADANLPAPGKASDDRTAVSAPSGSIPPFNDITG